MSLNTFDRWIYLKDAKKQDYAEADHLLNKKIYRISEGVGNVVCSQQTLSNTELSKLRLREYQPAHNLHRVLKLLRVNTRAKKKKERWCFQSREIGLIG